VPDAAYDFIESDAALVQPAQEANLIYFGTLIQRSSVSRETLAGLLDVAEMSNTFLDLNLRPDCFTKDTILDSLQRADILKLNEYEVKALAELASMPASSLPGFCEGVINRWSLRCCVVTLGERGAFAASSDGTQVYCPGYRVDVVDTCGSGDAFAAGFAHAWLERASLGECCRLGCQLGAIVATQPGGTTPVSGDELRVFGESPQQLIRQSELQKFESD
jgi:fructokinase